MMKSTISIICAFILILLVYGILTSYWERVYYISGALGLSCIAVATLTYFDKIILGDKGRLVSKKERKYNRTDVIKQNIAASGLFFIAAIVGLIFK